MHGRYHTRLWLIETLVSGRNIDKIAKILCGNGQIDMRILSSLHVGSRSSTVDNQWLLGAHKRAHLVIRQ